MLIKEMNGCVYVAAIIWNEELLLDMEALLMNKDPDFPGS